MNDSPSAAAIEAPTPWPAIAGIIATVSVFAISQGLTYPLLSLILERQGAQERRVYEAEHQGRGANAGRENEHGQRRESGSACDHAARMLKVS